MAVNTKGAMFMFNWLFGGKKRDEEPDTDFDDFEQDTEDDGLDIDFDEMEEEALAMLVGLKKMRNVERGFSERKALAYAIEGVASDKGIDTDELIEIVRKHPELS